MPRYAGRTMLFVPLCRQRKVCFCMYPGANRRPAHSNRQKVWAGAPESMLRKAWVLLSTLRRHCYAHSGEAYGGLLLAGADYHPARDGKAAEH